MAAHTQAIDNLRFPDLRTLSLGSGGVIESPLFNPSLLGFIDRNKLYSHYYNRYSISNLANVGGGLYYKNNILPAGFEITSFGYNDYRESMFRFSFGKRIANYWAIGVSFQYCMFQSLQDEENTGRISADIGITYRPSETFNIGLAALHCPSVKIGDKNVDNEHLVPYSIAAGINWRVTSSALITGSVENNREEPLTGSFGVEYQPFDDFHLRTGIRTTPLRPSLGVGYRFAGFNFDVGMLYHSVLGVSMGFGFSFNF